MYVTGLIVMVDGADVTDEYNTQVNYNNIDQPSSLDITINRYEDVLQATFSDSGRK